MECGDYIKNKHSGLKQNNVPQGGRASAQKPAVMPVFCGPRLATWTSSGLSWAWCLPVFFDEGKFFASDTDDGIVLCTTSSQLGADAKFFHDVTETVDRSIVR